MIMRLNFQCLPWIIGDAGAHHCNWLSGYGRFCSEYGVKLIGKDLGCGLENGCWRGTGGNLVLFSLSVA